MIYKHQLIVDQQEEILLDRRRSSYVIRRSDWTRLTAAIAAIPRRTSLFENAGWAALGIAGTFLVAALTLPSSAQTLASWLLPTCWIGGIASAAVGLLALRMQSAHGTVGETTKESCLALMRDLESGFGPSADDDTQSLPLATTDLGELKQPIVEPLRKSITEHVPKLEGDGSANVGGGVAHAPPHRQTARTEGNQLMDTLSRNVSRSVLGKKIETKG